MTNNEIGNFLKANGIVRPNEIIADSAEPKIIQELRLQ
jgi:hypothetical protein